MAVRGTEAKSQVKIKIAEAFGEDYIGEHGGKLYVWADDGGNKVQIAISLTCPKNEVGNIKLGADGGIDFTSPTVLTGPKTSEPAEITQEEQQNIADLIAALGL